MKPIVKINADNMYRTPVLTEQGLRKMEAELAEYDRQAVTSAHNSRAPARFDWADNSPGAEPDEWGPLAVFCACWVACLAVLIGIAAWAAYVNWGNA